MWIGKFKIKHDCFILNKMEQNNIKVLAYVLGIHEDNDSLYYTTFLIPIGSEERIIQFINDMKQDAEVINIEEHGGQLITLTKVGKNKKHVSSNFSHELFLMEPILHEHGYEYWHVASWNREKLVEFYERTQQVGSIEILKLQEEQVFDIFYPRIMPQLSRQQKRAFDLALEFGYYDYPQKIHLHNLAKHMQLSRMGYREHLRKAESKLFPFFAHSLPTNISD
ncbi:helix-turn-helix domain-containing protein [Candidatus Woesearchaeota archaeon]|nr:helix-turn-helix domain-containing protein [Candidatus Woesearchaeota archaeon]